MTDPIQQIIGLLSSGEKFAQCLGTFLVAALVFARIVVWRFRVRDMQQFAKALEQAPEDQRERLRSNPPPDLPSSTPLIALAALMLSGTLALSGQRASVARTAIEVSSCPRRCPNGEECVRGVCGKLARPPSPDLPSSPPESAAIFSASPLFYRRSPFERDE